MFGEKGGIHLWQSKNKKDEKFYEDLCNRYFQRIYYYCRKLVKGQVQLIDLVEECTQNTFLEARKQFSKLKSHPNIEGWLYTTARNLINNSYRSMYIKKRKEVILDDNFSSTLTSLDDELERIIDDSIDLDKLSVEILNKLSKNEYELYTDYYKNNMSVSDLAEKHDISSSAVTTRIYRLKKKTKNMVRDYFSEK